MNIDGNDRVLYKTFPTVTHINLASSDMVNGVRNDIYRFKVKADANGNISLKQLKFDLDVVDNEGTYNGSITVGTFKLFRGGTDISANVLIQNSAGATVESTNTFTTGTAQVVYVKIGRAHV